MDMSMVEDNQFRMSIYYFGQFVSTKNWTYVVEFLIGFILEK